MATVNEIERGKANPRLSTLSAIAAALGCTVGELTDDGKGLADDPDSDLGAMDHEALLAAARAMRRAIRKHRDATEHALCWHHPDMWALLPDTPKGGQVVPEWPQFMRGCIRYRASLDRQLPEAPRTNREFGE